MIQTQISILIPIVVRVKIRRMSASISQRMVGTLCVRIAPCIYIVPTELMDKHITYKYTIGWCRGRVTGIERNKKRSDYGMLIVKFVDFREHYRVQLKEEDYDIDDVWVEITKR